MQTADLVTRQASEPTVESANLPDGIKTILFHVHDDERLADRLQAALSMARCFGAHLHLLHVSPIEAYTVTDAFATFVNAEIVEVLQNESTKLKAKLEQKLASEDVSWDYEEVIGVLASHLAQRAALSDLVLMGHEPYGREFGESAISLLGDMLQRIRTPLFLIGDETQEVDLLGPAMVAWNGSYEAANALRSAVPLLKLASKVRLVSVEEPKDYRFPSTGALEFLSRHGIHAELVQRPQIDDIVEDELLKQAAAYGASYMVMGAYGHSRVGEFVFGGVTRSLLKACPVSLLMAH